MKAIDSPSPPQADVAPSGVEKGRRPRVFRVTAAAPELPSKDEPHHAIEEKTRPASLKRPGPVSIVYSKPRTSDAQDAQDAHDALDSQVAAAAVGASEESDEGRSSGQMVQEVASYGDVQRKMQELDRAIAAIRFARSVRFDIPTR